jgi:hypothetical protein
MAVDKGGAVVDRVEPGEVDHGQHDAVRDVFLAPGGCTLVRADLFADLGGFDPDIFVMGEDLDLCWRAQIAGARVLVAPQARVRHLEVLASGHRQLPAPVLVDIPLASDPVPPPDRAPAVADDDSESVGVDPPEARTAGAGTGPTAVRSRREIMGRLRAKQPLSAITLQSLQRRHELHVVLKSYGRFHLIRVLPQLLALASAEYVIARASGHRDRAAAVAHAWRWNLVRRRAIRSERVVVRAHRRLDDAEVRRLQLHGSARLNAYVRRAVNQGLKAAHLGAESDVGEGEAARDSAHRRRLRADALSLRVVVWLVAVLILVFGTRQLLGPGFPYVGQFLPLPSAGALLHRFLSGWQPSGVGTTDPTSPATGILGVAGYVLFGGVGLLQKIVVLGCIPAGAVGMARLVRPVRSPRARLASTLVYLAVPLPYDALATGRWDALVAYAASPWIVGFLARASRFAPFGNLDADGAPPPSMDLASRGAATDSDDASIAHDGFSAGVGAATGTGDVPAPAVMGEGPVPHAALGRPGDQRRWRSSFLGQMLGLGVLEALLTAAAPSGCFLVLMVGVGLALGSMVTGGRGGLRPAGRIIVTSVGATVVAFILLMPWSVALLAGPDRWGALTGLAIPASTAPSWGAILRLGLGPIGNTPLAWAFLLSAALPLFIGSRWRLGWAGRVWVMAIVSWVLAWTAGRGWLSPLAPSAMVLLAPAAVAVALAVGLGAASFESDLPGYRFGWRQAATVLAAGAAAVGVLPVLVASANGRWDVPLTGYGEATSWMAGHMNSGDFRVLWLGDPRVLPGGGWALSSGLAYSISEDGLGDATEMWSGSSPGAASRIGDSVQLARNGSTVRLGDLLAPYAVRYVVVVGSLAPSIPGFQTPVSYQPPADLEPALLSQLDLRQIIGQGGFDVYIDDAALPERAVLAPKRVAKPSTTTTTTTTASASVTAPTPVGSDHALSGWRPVLNAPPGATQATGRVPAGQVLAAVAPSHSWELVAPGGHVQSATTRFGYAASFNVARPGTVTVKYRGSAAHGFEITFEVLLWVVAVCLLVGRRRSWGRLWRRMKRRSVRRSERPRPDATTLGSDDEARHDPAGAVAPEAGVHT